MTPRIANPSPPQPDQPSFAWPPKESISAEPILTPSPPTESSSSARPIFDSIETHLLGRTGLAFDQWAQRNNWQRDTQDAYCWRCGSSIGPHESDGEGCAQCRSKALPWDRTIRLAPYKDTLRTEILILKFQAWRPTGQGLGKHLGLAIAEQLELAQIDPTRALLAPIPTHRFRRIARGVDHTMVLARAAAIASNTKAAPLLKTRYRPEQVGLSMTARAKNIKDAFSLTQRGQRILNKSKKAPPLVIILIDDVRTTGATFVAASKALKSAFKAQLKAKSWQDDPPQLWIACLGVAGESRRRDIEAQS